MAKQEISISEALGWLKTLEARRAELVALRNQNAQTTHSMYGDRETKIEPQYDAKALDQRITLLAREIRLCDTAVKRANSTHVLKDYEMDDDVLGEVA